jgi:ribose transport system permease protein
MSTDTPTPASPSSPAPPPPAAGPAAGGDDDRSGLAARLRTSLTSGGQGYAITLLLFIVLFVAVAALSPVFLNIDNLLNVLRQSSIVLIVAAAGTLVMISGGIDLSVGGVVALSGVIGASLAVHGLPMPLVVLAAMAAGAGVGLVNGVVCVGFGVTPIIGTLGTLYISQGLAFIISGGQAVVVGLPPSFNGIGQSFVLGIPAPVVFAAVVLVVFYVLLHRTLLGKYTYAIGGNPDTAFLSGLPVRRVQMLLYVLSGGAAGLGGIILASRLGSGQPAAATDLIFSVIIAIVLGGTSLAGGSGTMIGTGIGTLFVAVLGNGLDLIGVESFYQFLALGTVLIIAAIIDVTLKGAGMRGILPRRRRPRVLPDGPPAPEVRG